MPRSGTKLVRAILNGHPRINLAQFESHFIPYFIKKYGQPAPFAAEQDLRRLGDELRQTPYFQDLETRYKRTLRIDDFVSSVRPDSWASVFEYVLRFGGPEEIDRSFVYGDKTPGYINHMPMLKQVFPTARFLHVVRDPRDYALSMKKSFGKSLYWAAEMWRKTLTLRRQEGLALGGDYMELHYEDLLASPAQATSEVCAFLECEFERAMVDEVRTTESTGDARGVPGIVSDNTNKYLRELSRRKIRRLEEIVTPLAEEFGYQVSDEIDPRPLAASTGWFLRLRDAVVTARRKGLGRYTVGRIQSSWR